MKKISLFIAVFALSMGVGNAQINMNKVKEKAKEKVSSSGNSGNSNSEKSNPSTTTTTETQEPAKVEKKEEPVVVTKLAEFTVKTLTDGTYFTTQKDLKDVTVKGCCDGMMTVKFNAKAGSSMSPKEYKRSSYVGDMYFERYDGEIGFHIFKELGILADFKVDRSNGDLKFYELISMDPKVVSLDASEKADLKAKTQAALKDWLAKKKAAEAAEEEKEINARNLPASKMTNATLQSQLMAAVKEYAKSKNWNATFHKVIITAPEWTIYRNEYTGIITKRNIEFAAVYTDEDGRCFYETFYFAQDHDGSAYQKTLYYDGLSGRWQINCSKTK